MNYYYDLILNFLEENTLFYEWEKSDALEYIKKIPVFHVSSDIFNDFYTNIVKVSEGFLKEIDNKTILNKEKIKYACILADKNNAYAYEFNSDGLCLFRSSLKVKDELEVLDLLYEIDLKDISYEIIKKIDMSKEIRQVSKIKKLVNLEINKLYQDKNYEKLKYLYLEWFLKKETDIEKIYNDMKKELKKGIDEKLVSIYDIIKLSYNKV